MEEQNNKLYVNVEELLGLLDCMQVAADNLIVAETIQEVINTVHEIKWKEIKDDES